MKAMKRGLIIAGLIFFLTGFVWALGENRKDNWQAADFTLKDLQGKNHTLSQYKGKFVFLNFWATWCPPCRSEMPSMQKLYVQSDKKLFVMLAVNLSQDKKTVEDFVRQNGYTFPVLLDNGEVANKYRVQAIPQTMLIDRTGKIVSQFTGAKEWTWAEIKPFLK